MTTPQGQVPEALTHAAGLESFADMLPAYGFTPKPLKDAAATIRALHAQVAALTQPAQVSAVESNTAYALPDFDTVEQHIYGACRRYITQDMLEPIHNLIREAIDADRASHGQAPAGAAPEPEPIAYLHDDGYWTPAKTDEGRKLNDRLHFAGSPKIGVHLAPTAQAAPAAGAVAGPLITAPKMGETYWDTHGGMAWERTWEGMIHEWDRFAAGLLYRSEADALAAAPTPAAQAHSGPLKDHQIAALGNELRDIAVKFHGTQQLRERIAHVVVPALRAGADSGVQEDAARNCQHEILPFGVDEPYYKCKYCGYVSSEYRDFNRPARATGAKP
jgi:hypothetical protein